MTFCWHFFADGSIPAGIQVHGGGTVVQGDDGPAGAHPAGQRAAGSPPRVAGSALTRGGHPLATDALVVLNLHPVEVSSS